MNIVNKLLKALDENDKIQFDECSYSHRFESGMKKWVANIVPAELLSRSVKDAVNSLATL